MLFSIQTLSGYVNAAYILLNNKNKQTKLLINDTHCVYKFIPNQLHNVKIHTTNSAPCIIQHINLQTHRKDYIN